MKSINAFLFMMITTATVLARQGLATTGAEIESTPVAK
jgi:hypothetical protein